MMILDWADSHLGGVRSTSAGFSFSLCFSEILLHLHREHVSMGTGKSRYFSRISLDAQPALSIR